MTAVFLIGLYAGRDQGVRAALAEYGGEVARIPVSDPATTALTGSVVAGTELAATPEQVLERKVETLTEQVVPPQVAEMDFRPEAKVRAGAPQLKDEIRKDSAPEPTKLESAPSVVVAEAASKKTNEKVESPKAASTKPAGSWYIQAGAARSDSEAAGYVRKFKAAGIQAKVERADVRGNLYFRVIVGPYTDKSAADKDLRKVANSKILKSEPFVRLIK
jgi:cell division protein FtsN